MTPADASSLPPSSFDKFTAQARQALAAAQEAARARNHDHLGTEHLLLGVLDDEDGSAAMVLRRVNVSPVDVRQRIVGIIGTGDRPLVSGEICLTPRVKQVVELAVEEAQRMHQDQVDTVHLLLGLARERNGIAGRVLRDLHVDLGALRRATAHVPPQPSQAVPSLQLPAVTDAGGAPVPEFAAGTGPKSNVVTCRLDDTALEALDTLVAAGIRPTRSDAAAWLIRIGLEANRPLLQRVAATVAEIRRLRLEAQSLATTLPGEDLPE
jgi:hypothetical protein